MGPIEWADQKETTNFVLKLKGENHLLIPGRYLAINLMANRMTKLNGHPQWARQPLASRLDSGWSLEVVFFFAIGLNYFQTSLQCVRVADRVDWLLIKRVGI